jgi:CRISPR-associated endoribonuclease Cas6
MPHSLVLNLIPQGQISSQFLTGRHHHALFLDLVRSVDVDLASQLHQQTSAKAFTLSALQVQAGSRKPILKGSGGSDRIQWSHAQPIASGTPCWWRVSLLDDLLFSKLATLWLGIDPDQPWHLGQVPLQVVSVLCNPQSGQSWANYRPYRQIYEQASESDRTLSFEFYTPTAFRETDYDTSLPTPEHVFKSLLKRWNQYSQIPFEEAIVVPIYPSFFDIRTEMVMDSRSKFIGCVGRVSYQILGDVEPEMIRQINTLANYAEFCGVGRKTPMGMGMVRRCGKLS